MNPKTATLRTIAHGMIPRITHLETVNGTVQKITLPRIILSETRPKTAADKQENGWKGYPQTDTLSFFLHILKYGRRGDDVSLDFISSKDVLKYIDRGNAVVIDIRDGDEYHQGHIPGAVSMPYDTFDDKAPILKKYEYIILCCDRGAASLLLGRKLSGEGYQVLSIGGGMNAWRGPVI